MREGHRVTSAINQLRQQSNSKLFTMNSDLERPKDAMLYTKALGAVLSFRSWWMGIRLSGLIHGYRWIPHAHCLVDITNT
uniref:Uncharacterized protein n=1 Tax=Ciona savignyi TaxID=51511 RepID=H2Z3S3_CIOSA